MSELSLLSPPRATISDCVDRDSNLPVKKPAAFATFLQPIYQVVV